MMKQEKFFVLYSCKCIIYQTDVASQTSAFLPFTAVKTSRLSVLKMTT